MSLIALAAAASFACTNPTHHDGDNLRCSNVDGSMRLNGIDAPEMPGGCRPGRACVDGDPFAARDYLRGLTADKVLQCVVEDTDAYDRRVVNCTADGVNIGCAMIAGGHAVPRYAPLDCGGGSVVAEDRPVQSEAPPEPMVKAEPLPAPVFVPASTPTRDTQPRKPFGIVLIGLAGLALINLITWGLFAIDKRRAQAGRSRERIAEATLLGWAAIGGSPAAWHAMSVLRHKSSKESFRLRLMLICGVQAGVAIGAAWLWFGS